MNLVFHVLRKDACRLRISLIFWLITLLAVAAINALRPTLGTIFQGENQLFIHAIAMLAQLIFMALIIPKLIHGEPLTQTTAFWLTRPIRRSDVLKSKLLFAGLFFVALPALIHLLSLITCRVHLTLIGPMLLEYLLHCTTATLLFISIASLTHKTNHYINVCMSYLLLSIVFGSVTLIYGHQLQNSWTASFIALQDSRTIISAALSLFFLCLLLQIHYRNKAPKTAYFLLFFHVLASAWITNHLSYSICKAPGNPLPTELAHKTQPQLNMYRGIRIRDEQNKTHGPTQNKTAWGRLSYTNLPEGHFAYPRSITPSFQTTGYNITNAVIHAYPPRTDFSDLEALQAIIEPLDLIPEKNHWHYSHQLLQLPKSEFVEFRYTKGTYEADVKLDLYRYRSPAHLPLERGREYSTQRARISISSILQETEGCTVIIREQYSNPLFNRDRTPVPGGRFAYLLANRTTKEAFLPSQPRRWPAQLPLHPLSINTKLLHFTSIDKATCRIDESWLRDAELLIVENEWIGETTQQIVQVDFRLEKPKADPKVIRGTEAHHNHARLEALHLPTTPTRDEVRNYILAIHGISASQDITRKTDPQIQMLLDIGPEHLDLLLQQVRDYPSTYHERRALRHLAQPEHKELVLQNLLRVPVLAKAILNYKWYEEARSILILGLQEHETLPVDWLLATLALEDPATYPHLAEFFVRAQYRSKTYAHINKLPNIQLDNVVARAWEQAKNESMTSRNDMIPIAISHGQTDALLETCKALKNKRLSKVDQERLKATFRKHTGISGSPEELRNWYDEHHGKLKFDPATKMYLTARELNLTRVVLMPDDAVIEGYIRNYRERGYLGYWTRPEDRIRFNVPDLKPGTYKIALDHVCPRQGGEVSFKFNDQEFKQTFTSSENKYEPEHRTIGYYEHQGGPVEINLNILKQNVEHKAVIKLYALTLEG